MYPKLIWSRSVKALLMFLHLCCIGIPQYYELLLFIKSRCVDLLSVSKFLHMLCWIGIPQDRKYFAYSAKNLYLIAF